MEAFNEDFTLQELSRVTRLFCKKHKPGFQTKNILASWYVEQLQRQDFKCYYCGTSIFVIRHLISLNKLKTRKTGYGVRGPVLEIDKMKNERGYSPSNCVLSCYYCNNDKSYSLDSEDYKRFFGPARNQFFIHLTNLLNEPTQ